MISTQMTRKLGMTGDFERQMADVRWQKQELAKIRYVRVSQRILY